MMYTDGFSHSLDYFDEPFYLQQNVTAETFPAMKSYLWKNQGIVLTEGMKKIKFNYYSPQDQLLASDVVPVLTEGSHVPVNLGSTTGFPSSPKEGDYFMYTADNGAYPYGTYLEYKDGSWSEVPEDSKKVAEALPDALADDTLDWDKLSENESAVATLIERLSVNEAFIKKLATCMITMQKDESGKGGLIKSSNYNGTIDGYGNITEYGDKGWAIDHEGKSDFANGNFSGTLNCGSLQVNKKVIEYEHKTINTNRDYKAFIESFCDTSDYFVYDYAHSYVLYYMGVIGPKRFNVPNIKFVVNGVEWNYMLLYLRYNSARYVGADNWAIIRMFNDFETYDTDYQDIECRTGNVLYDDSWTFSFFKLKDLYEKGVTYCYNNNVELVHSTIPPIRNDDLSAYNISWYYTEDKLIFMLENLPTAKPQTEGIVYSDSGTLKLS